MTDFAARRMTMVDTQVRPSDVTKYPIIDAMLDVPREEFVPVDQREAAYVGENLPIGPGRVVLEPRTLAKMLDAANVQKHEMVLDIATGLGYSAALLSHLAEAVVAVEDDAARAADAEAALADCGADNVAVVTGPLAEGAAKHGPYDVILVQGGVVEVPQALLDQLAPEGRIVCIFMEGALGVCRIGHRGRTGVHWRYLFNAGAPVLPGFAAEAAFAL